MSLQTDHRNISQIKDRTIKTLDFTCPENRVNELNSITFTCQLVAGRRQSRTESSKHLTNFNHSPVRTSPQGFICQGGRNPIIIIHLDSHSMLLLLRLSSRYSHWGLPGGIDWIIPIRISSIHWKAIKSQTTTRWPADNDDNHDAPESIREIEQTRSLTVRNSGQTDACGL